MYICVCVRVCVCACVFPSGHCKNRFEMHRLDRLQRCLSPCAFRRQGVAVVDSAVEHIVPVCRRFAAILWRCRPSPHRTFRLHETMQRPPARYGMRSVALGRSVGTTGGRPSILVMYIRSMQAGQRESRLEYLHGVIDWVLRTSARATLWTQPWRAVASGLMSQSGVQARSWRVV